LAVHLAFKITYFWFHKSNHSVAVQLHGISFQYLHSRMQLFIHDDVFH